MEQQIRLCTTRDGIRIAYATVGRGPAFVVPPGWISHLELDWGEPAQRAFFETLARHHTIIRYDKYGCGLSDRDRSDFGLEPEVRILETIVDHLKLKQMALFTISQAGPTAVAYVVKHPSRVSHLILYGTYARRDAIANDQLRAALIPLIRAHWGIGSTALADVFLPGVDAPVREWFARMQREAATKEMAIKLVEVGPRLDVADLAQKLRVPTLVIHRRGDLMVPFRLGRELAALIPKARFVPLDGNIHRPYFGDADSVLRVIAEFLGDPVDTIAAGAVRQPPAPDAPARQDGRPVQRMLATVLFTDIVGSTQWAAKLGDKRWGDLLHEYLAVVRAQLDHHRGREIDAAGDGVLAVFDAPARAIQCACAIRTSVKSLRMKIRAGLHTGECEMVGPTLRGIAVHIGARVASRAVPGEILVSSTVRDLVSGSGVRFEARGVHALKGVPGKWRLFAVTRAPANPKTTPAGA